jgi:hypothetical protein
MGVVRFLESLPTVMKLWRELSKKESALGNCIDSILGLDHPAKRAIAAEWLNSLPVILQLCEKLPARTEAICRYIKVLPVLMQISRNLPEGDSVFLQQYRELSSNCVIREESLVDMSRGKKVLHFGFLDSPFSEERIKSKELLHLNIKPLWIGIDD